MAGRLWLNETWLSSAGGAAYRGAEAAVWSGGPAILVDESADPVDTFDIGVGVVDGVEMDRGVQFEAAWGRAAL